MTNYDYNLFFISQRGKQRRANNEWIANKSQEEKPFAELVVTAEGVENCESSAVLSLVLHLGLPGEYFKTRCFSIQIVYEQKSYLQQ